jgi:hypothetical protein
MSLPAATLQPVDLGSMPLEGNAVFSDHRHQRLEGIEPAADRVLRLRRLVDGGRRRRLSRRSDPVEYLFVENAHVTPKLVEPQVDDVEPLVDVAEPLVDVVEPLVDFREPLIDAVEPLVDFREPLIDAVEPLVDFREPLIDSVEPLIDFRELLIDMVEPLVDFREPLIDSIEPLFGHGPFPSRDDDDTSSGASLEEQSPCRAEFRTNVDGAG